jgi:hypothetical protein
MGQNSHQIAIKDAKRKAVFEALQERADKKQILYSRV